ncbi:MAG: hypothetical protein RL885_04600 [Planctomycetota bacterium]
MPTGFLRGDQLKSLALLVLFTALVVSVTLHLAPVEASPQQADANRDLIAVTGQYGQGTSVLYVVDTKRRQLAVYEAKGGTQSKLSFVAARRIDLDLQLVGYNDESKDEVKYWALKKYLESKDASPSEESKGVELESDSRVR